MVPHAHPPSSFVESTATNVSHAQASPDERDTTNSGCVTFSYTLPAGTLAGQLVTASDNLTGTALTDKATALPAAVNAILHRAHCLRGHHRPPRPVQRPDSKAQLANAR